MNRIADGGSLSGRWHHRTRMPGMRRMGVSLIKLRESVKSASSAAMIHRGESRLNDMSGENR
jgi:hypothetical protein